MGALSDFVAKTLHMGGTQAVQDHFDKPPVASHTQPVTTLPQAAAAIRANPQNVNDAVDAMSR